MHTTSAFAKWGKAFQQLHKGTGSIDELKEQILRFSPPF
jgi:hypothetical protein